jgi:hypothetical protein
MVATVITGDGMVVMLIVVIKSGNTEPKQLHAELRIVKGPNVLFSNNE